MRAALIMCMLLALAACAPKVAPLGEAPTTAHLTDDGFVTDDGLTLPERKWLPPTPRETRAVVLAVHGFNDYSKAFDKVPAAPGVGPFLAERGIAVYAYDQRGFGNAPNRGVWGG